MAEWPYTTARWQRLRTAHLQRFPLCEWCEATGRIVVARAVDHRKPIKLGGEPFPDHDGLASYCIPCHSAKTVRGPEAGARRSAKPRKGCNPDGSPLDPAHPWHASAEALPNSPENLSELRPLGPPFPEIFS
jgi:5-methylcytosine-specific restriction enzyme A